MTVDNDLAQKSLLHLHAAANAVLPLSQSISSHLASTLLSSAQDNEVNLPQSYVESRICQSCGSLFLPGVNSRVRLVQSRRQKRKAKSMAWVIYECKVCEKRFKNEVEVSKPNKSAPVKEEKEIKFAEVLQVERKEEGTLKKRKRKGVQGLKMAIEKRKEEEERKTVKALGLTDLMKTD